MVKRKTVAKLTGKPAGAVALASESALLVGEAGDFPDALHFLNSLSQERDGIDWDIRVYQLTGGMGRGQSNKQLFLFNIALEDMPSLESNLADQYPGGGSFRVQARADGALVKNIAVEIAPRPGFKPPPPSYLTPAAVPHAEATGGDRMENFFARLAEQAREDARLTRELIAAIAGRPAVAPPTLSEQLAIFKQFQELAPQGAQSNAMAMFQQGIDTAKSMMELSGGGGGKGWMDVFSDAINSPAVKEIILAAASGVKEHAAHAQLPPPVQQLVSPNNPVAVQMIDTLIRQANLKIAPEEVARQIVDMAPQALMDELETQGDILAYLIHQFPPLGPHRAWLEQVVSIIWEKVPDEATPSPTLSHAPQKTAGT